MSPAELRRHRENLEEFQRVYLEWRETLPSSSERVLYRERVMQLEPVARRAIDASGQAISHRGPPFLGGETVFGLSSYLIGLTTYPGGTELDFPLRIVLSQCIAELREREREEAAKRRDPLYWADRAFRLLVSPVGYVIHAIFDVDVARSSFWGPTAKILSLVFEGVVAVAAGRAAGWW
jgi:hypothetical protein